MPTSRFTEKIESVDGISQAHSIAKARGIDGGPGGLDLSPLYAPEKAFDAERLKQRVQENPLFHGRLVSKDGKTALIVAKMAATENIDAVRDSVLELVGDRREHRTSRPHRRHGCDLLASIDSTRGFEVFIAATIFSSLSCSDCSSSGGARPYHPCSHWSRIAMVDGSLG